MESHGGRPEIRDALDSGEGSSIRNSDTADSSTFYYAVRLDSGDVLRLAQEASSIWSIYMRSAPLILLLAAAGSGGGEHGTGAPADGAACSAHRADDLAPEQRQRRGALSRTGTGSKTDMIEQQHEEILRSANMRAEFTANVSHELKTPLTSISGYAELIESGMAQGEQAKTFAAEIHKSAKPSC